MDRVDAHRADRIRSIEGVQVNFYQHHIGDFRSGTINMTRLERWIYRDMTDVYYDKEKALPNDLDLVCNSVGARTDEERKIVEDLLRFKFKLQDDGWHHDRCDEEIAQYHAKAEAARDNGKRGGRPSIKTQAEPKITQPVSENNPALTGSEANHKPVTSNQEPRKSKPSAPAAPLPDWLPIPAWEGFLAMRKAIKKPITPEAVPLALKKLDSLREAGNNPQAVLEQSTLNSWQGLFEIKTDHQPRGSPLNRQEALEQRNREVAERLSRTGT
jgi:uncharacterized protein YdaU (DUF1376 family)